MDELGLVRTEAEPNYERIHQGLKESKVLWRHSRFRRRQNRPERSNLDVQPITIEAVEPFREQGIDIQLTCQLSTEVFTLEDDIHTIMGELLQTPFRQPRKVAETPHPLW